MKVKLSLFLLIFTAVPWGFTQHIGLQLGSSWSPNPYARVVPVTAIFLDIDDFNSSWALVIEFGYQLRRRQEYPCPDCERIVDIDSEFKRYGLKALVEGIVVTQEKFDYRIGMGLSYDLIESNRDMLVLNGLRSSIRARYSGPALSNRLIFKQIAGTDVSIHLIAEFSTLFPISMGEVSMLRDPDPDARIQAFQGIQYLGWVKLGLAYPLGD